MKFTSENQPENKGRKPGTPNKQTTEIKDVILSLITAINKGGIQELVDDLRKNKPEILVKALVSLAPKDLNINANIISNPLADELKALREGDKNDE